jgi:CDP-4-dehydro-6-deoxyglucose reductase, E3
MQKSCARVCRRSPTSILHNDCVKVRVYPSNREFEARGDEPVLGAALRQHLNLPHSCKGGSCGSCRVRVLRGRYAYPHGRPIGISADEEAAGYALICQARALEDLAIEIREIRNVTDVEIRELPARIARMERLAPDVMGLWLRLPAIEPFAWQAGQYVDVMLPGERRRSFSLANPPRDSALLELHVRRAPGGLFSEQVFDGLRTGSLLRIEGPLGQFIYRPGDRPLLLVGGGTGYAPLKAMIREALESGTQREITLFWGARTTADLYDDAWLRSLAATHPQFRYVPVLSEEVGTTLETGLVHEAVLRNIADLSRFDVYAAGPPAMIDAIRESLPRQGADPGRIAFDSFDYAPA